MISDYILYCILLNFWLGGFASQSSNQLASKVLTQNQNKETSQPKKQPVLLKSFDSNPKTRKHHSLRQKFWLKSKKKQLASKPKTGKHQNRVVCVKMKTRREVTAKQKNRYWAGKHRNNWFLSNVKLSFFRRLQVFTRGWVSLVCRDRMNPKRLLCTCLTASTDPDN